MSRCEKCIHKKVCIDGASFKNAQKCKRFKERAKNGQNEGCVKNNWRYADKALKLIGDDKNA